MRKSGKEKRLTGKEAVSMLKHADLLELGRLADVRRKERHPDGVATFIIDRNINYTNVCINRCRFCAFWRDENDPEAYLLDRKTLFRKIRETIDLGGTQILLQGGLHPSLDLDYYIDLLMSVKKRFNINIHGFSPPEICYMADTAGISVRETLDALRDAGLDSIPGGGAEILSDRVREVLSPRKIKSSRWLDVMEHAHEIGMKTTATMMFGSIEKPEDIVIHLESIRNLQDRTGGFTAFIPWSFQSGNTDLGAKDKRKSSAKKPVHHTATAVEYLRVLSLSRIYLDNVRNIQASWVTQGLKLAQVALRFGANDLGSTMIEENVVASAGVTYRASRDELIQAIREAGFRPAQRDTGYSILKRF